MMKRLAVVVKYYHPIERISGIIGYLTPLTRRLAEEYELHIITYRSPASSERIVRKDGYTIHRVRPMFPLAAGRKLREIDPHLVLVISGIYRFAIAIPYFALFNAAAPKKRMFFYQATNVRGRAPRLFKTILDRYERVLCSSRLIAQAFSSGLGIEPILIPPAVDIAALRGTAASAKPKKLRVGFVNHLNRVKGADIAARVFAKTPLPEVEYVIAGTGELEDDLRSRYGSDDITFHGFLKDDARLALIQSCDLMVLPFRTGVSVLGLSQTVLECMALGVVVVGSATAAIAPAIDNGVDGFLFSSEEELVEQLETLYEQPELRARVSASAQETANKQFSIDRVAETLGGIFLET